MPISSGREQRRTAPSSRCGRGRRGSRAPGRMPRYFSAIRSSSESASSRAVAPLAARLAVQPLRERLGQPVGQRLGHDRVVVVELGLEAARDLVGAEARGDRERADVVAHAARARRHVVGQAADTGRCRCSAAAGAASGSARRSRVRDSSSKSTRSSPSLHAGQKPYTPRARSSPPSISLRSSARPLLEELARGRALRRAVEDRGEAALELPGGEEEGPVDQLRELGERHVVEHAPADELGRRDGRPRRTRARRARARVGERDQRPLEPRRVREPQPLLRRAVRAVELGPLRRRRARSTAPPPRATRPARARSAARTAARSSPRCAASRWSRRRSGAAASKPWRCISFATCTISSSDGVIRPERPIAWQPSARAVSRMRAAGTITPRSITS